MRKEFNIGWKSTLSKHTPSWNDIKSVPPSVSYHGRKLKENYVYMDTNILLCVVGRARILGVRLCTYGKILNLTSI